MNIDYKYNGIEEVDDFGLDLSFATFRTLDPSIGRWLQVDPKAEAVSSLSPYQSMGNNPISNADPAGDLFFAIPQISFNGGFSVGLEVGFGLPGGASISATGTVGANPSWSVQGRLGGVYAGYGSNGVFAGVGYEYAGASIGFDFTSGTVNAGYGIGRAGVTGFGASGGVSYNLVSRSFGYNVGASYTHIFEKPLVENTNTFSDNNAAANAVQQRKTHDCLIGACEFMGPETYNDLLKIVGDAYTPGKGSNTLLALQRIYGVRRVQRTEMLFPDVANLTWQRGGSVLAAQNRNHAIVLSRIEELKVTYKYRKNNIQTKYRLTYMNPATGTFQSTGMIRRYNHPIFYIRR